MRNRRPDFRGTRPIGQNGWAMDLESRDSVNLKPAELDVLGQILGQVGSRVGDGELDRQVESFPLVCLTSLDEELHGFLFGSLERIGGTPCVLWGLGSARRGKQAGPSLKALVGELYRRAAISFPDEDVLVAGLIAHPGGYSLLGGLSDICPRPGYSPTGEERAWGRRLAKRFGCNGRYEDRTFRVKKSKEAAPVFDTRTMKVSNRSKAAEMLGAPDPDAGEGVIAFGWASAEALEAGLTPGRR